MDLNKQRPPFYQHRPKGDPWDPQPLRRREDVAGGAFSREAEEKLFGRKRAGTPAVRSLRDGRPGDADALTRKRSRADAVRDKSAAASERARVAAQWSKTGGPPKLHRLAASAPPPPPMARRATGPAAPTPGGCGLLPLVLLLGAVLGIVAARW